MFADVRRRNEASTAVDTERACLRVGVIGLGSVAEVHLDAYRRARGIAVVAAADVLPERAHATAERFGVRAYLDHVEMLRDARLDIVCILTGPQQRLAIALDCADHGVPTLCEKPLSVSVEEGRRIVERFAEVKVPLFYGSSYRFLPAVAEARRLIADGAIGDVRLLREDIVGGAGPESQHDLPYYPRGLPGGTPMGLVDHGIHLIDIMAWLTASPITSVFGRGNRAGAPLGTEFAILRFACGAVGQLTYDEGSWSTALPSEGIFSGGAGWDRSGYVPAGRWQGEPGCIHVHGTTGALRIVHYANALFLKDADGVREIPLARRCAPDHFAAQIESFADAVRDGAPPSTTAGEGLTALKVLHAIYASDDAGIAIPIEQHR